MAKLNIIRGDLLELFKLGDFNNVAHGCNCFHTMGSGIAKQFKQEYPNLYTADIEHGEAGDISRLGKISVYEFTELEAHFDRVYKIPKSIFNIYTQFRYGREKKHFVPEALLSGLTEIYKSGIEDLAIPAIGTGLAGGSLEELIEVILDAPSDMNITLVMKG